MKRRQPHNTTGFTLVEILTAIAVVGILLALLIPALSAVQDTAMKVKQRTQFHSIEVALETFSTDTGDYPPSQWNTATYGNYTASQRLAEALVGRDGFGFHKDSLWRESGTDTGGNSLYFPDFTPADDAERDANLSLRLGPYLELESANAVKLSDLYYGGINYGNLVNSYVLADQFKITKNKASGKMTGSPILYYKADTTKIGHDPALAQIGNNTYSITDAVGNESADNDSIVDLKPLSTKTGRHPMSTMAPNDINDAMKWFYTNTQNPNFTSPPRPYRAESFILQSAGPDGLYGTSDDLFNFDREE